MCLVCHDKQEKVLYALRHRAFCFSFYRHPTQEEKESMIWLEVQFWRVAKWLIRKGYGADCDIPDFEDFPEEYKTMEDLLEKRCASCLAKDIIKWIDRHIELLKM